MSVESDLIESLAQFLNDAGVGKYSPAGSYASSDTAIVFGPLPTEPDRVIALTIYGSTDLVVQAQSSFRVQVWCRGVPNNSLDAGNLASSIFDVLQGIERLQWGDLFLLQSRRVSLGVKGIDANNRAERSDNYVLAVNTPPTVGRPV